MLELLKGIPIETLAWVSATFIFLQGVQKFLDFISKRTANKTDDKVAFYLNKLVGWVNPAIDWLMGNKQH